MSRVDPKDARLLPLARAIAANGHSNLSIVEPFVGETAEFFYSLWGTADADIGRVLQSVDARPGSVIDVGSGDARLTIALAAAGYRSVGIELSSDMHKAALARLAQADQDTRSRVRLLHSDFRAVPRQLSGCHSVVSIGLTIPILDASTRSELFRFAADALAKGGRFVFDVLDLQSRAEATFATTFQRSLQSGELELVFLDCLHSPRTKKQITNLVFERISSQCTRRYLSIIECTVMDMAELEEELHTFGFRIESVQTIRPTDEQDIVAGDAPGWGVSHVCAVKTGLNGGTH